VPTDLRTRWLLTASALVLAVVGVVLTFMPQEFLASVGERPSAPLVLLAQLGGAMAMSWAILDWMSRGQRVGGIYSRPLAVANALQFTMGSLTLVRMVAMGAVGFPEAALAVPYVLLTAWWFAALSRSPV
jgi:hypothetical protein